MKTTNRLLLLAAVFAFFTYSIACKKDQAEPLPGETPPPPPTQQPQPFKWARIKATDIDDPFAKFYTYDDSGRIISQHTSYDTLLYKYSDNTISVTEYSDGTAYEYESYMTKDGLAYQFDYRSNQDDEYSKYYYTPSKQRQLAVDTFKTGGFNRRFVYFHTGGNTDSVKIYNYTNHLELLLKYEYYTDKKNTIGNEAFGKLYFGADNVNPVKRSTTLVQGRYLAGYTDYTYRFDSLGRITKLIGQRDGNQTTSFSTTYTYY